VVRRAGPAIGRVRSVACVASSFASRNT
jgi:hypothetical protein